MRILLAGGSGSIGQALCQIWAGSKKQVTVLGRDKDYLFSVFGDKHELMTWDEIKANPDLSHYDLVINLCGANVSAKRWTATYKQQMLDSRLQPTAWFAEQLAKTKSKPRWFNASGIGLYGIQKPKRVGLPKAQDEYAEIKTHASFLSQLVKQWEAATQPAIEAGITVVQLRLAMVLMRHLGALPKIALSFYLGLGGRIGNGGQAWSWISDIDCARAIDFLCSKPEVSGPINLVAMQCVRQEEFARSLGRALHRPSVIPTPGFVMRTVMGPMADELILNGQHVVPTRLSELGFQFEYPDLDSALAKIYA